MVIFKKFTFRMEYSVLVLLILELYTHFLYNILIIEERKCLSNAGILTDSRIRCSK